ncbi:hypothetical protein P280DRAFT_470538 [Massarina eburnea CBS 473.64]|uniref:Uncharacterized protein n=1 Tax=Massarina eburnea CBS 473.64 TaxID=1395130 RepID=A0A6A6RYV6_9PLEO|nr:hypothetical protein P280DRAFT_470538 [Massarina eburnea CBS 473.64]
MIWDNEQSNLKDYGESPPTLSSMRSVLRQTKRAAQHDYTALQNSIPAFLCPALLRTPIVPISRRAERTPSRKLSVCRRLPQEVAATAPDAPSESPIPHHGSSTPAPYRRGLPRTCTGCGAPTQIYDKDEAGYYDVDRKALRRYLAYDANGQGATKGEDDVYSKALKQMDPKLLEEIGLEREVLEAGDHVDTSAPEMPVCDRCHNLVHHHTGVPIFHPSVDAIQQTIAESPHRRNHIYHVIDAADFPLSLVPTLQSSLRIPKLRTQNRRAKHKGWVANDRIAEVSFIITRADLLAPKKEQVDVLMPYMKDVLRDALGRSNKLARLGNVRLVSAKRGWWTKQVKEDIWERGGAGWMVGKVNVGKSNLFEVVFPKGRGADYQDVRKIRSAADREAMLEATQSLDEYMQVQKQLADEDAENARHDKLANEKAQRSENQETEKQEEPQEEEEEEEEEEDFDLDALLPPPQPYTPYPIFPIASSLPGTTASPIRIPFGRNRGELVDLPGLARTTPGLETFVQPEFQSDLVMTSRINSQRFTLKPGQSLILGGGLIRITPTTPDLHFLIHPFVPIEPHITRTDKAVDYQAQVSERNIESILTPGIGDKMRSAGTFKLKWDVTKKLAGPLTSSVAAKMRPENLPFRIFSTDILVEGVGWLELSAQLRRPQGWRAPGMVKKDPNAAAKAKAVAQQKAAEERERKYQAKVRGEEYVGDEVEEEDLEDVADFPEVEVFSPLGRFVGQRRPMCASTVSGPKYVASRDRDSRPRRSMKSVKMQRKPMERW